MGKRIGFQSSAILGLGMFWILWTGCLITAPIAIGADEVVFAVIDDISGPFAAQGDEAVKGAKLALEEVGNKVLGKGVKLIVRDSELKPAVAVRRFREVVEQEHPVYVYTGNSTAVQLAMMQVAEEKKTLFWANSAGDQITQAGSVNRYTFRWNSSSFTMANFAVAGFIRKFPEAKNFFAITVDYVWGHSMFEMEKVVIEKMGGKVLGNVLTPMEETDYSGAVTKALSARPDVIVINSFGSPLSKCIRTIHEFGAKQKAKVLIPSADLAFMRGVGSESLQGVYVSTDWWHEAENDFSRKFVGKYRERYNITPSHIALGGYVSLLLSLRAMERAASTEADKIICALEGYKYDGPSGKEEIRAFDHQVTHPIVLGVGKRPGEKKYEDDYLEIISSGAIYRTYEQNPVVWKVKLPCDK